MSVPHIAGITDDELMVYAMREAQLILASGARATLRKRSTYYWKFSIVRTSSQRPIAYAVGID